MLLSVIHKNNALSQDGRAFAGSTTGVAGYSNDTGSNARFNAPSHIVGDGTGSFYISDSGNHVIRKVDQFGVVTLVFGTPESSGNTLTTLNSPRGLALDASNNLYIADYSNNRVLYLSNGASTASNVATVQFVEEIAVNSNGTEMVFRKNLNSGANLVQYRNGVLEGTISTTNEENSNIYPFNIASVACSPDGRFYYSARGGQFNIQISMFNMLLSPPTIYDFNCTLETVFAYFDGTYKRTSTIAISPNPVNLGLGPGIAFEFYDFSSGSGFNGYSSVTTGAYGGYPDGVNGFTFDFIGLPQNFPLGETSVGTISNDIINPGASYNVIGFKWDTANIFLDQPDTGPNDSNFSSPQEELRMNIYLQASAFPTVPFQGDGNVYPDPNADPIEESGVTTLSGFTGVFAVYNGQTFSNLKIKDWPIPSYTISGNTGVSTVTHNQTGLNICNVDKFVIGSRLVGPFVEPDTVITSVTSTTFDTNKPWIFSNLTSVSFKLLPATSFVHSYTDLPSRSNILVGTVLVGPSNVSTSITEVSPNFSDLTKGTVRTADSFTSLEEFYQEAVYNDRGQLVSEAGYFPAVYTASGTYSILPWIGTSTRVASVVFPAANISPPIGGKCKIVLIDNNPTAMTIDGALYGGALKYLQFQKNDSSSLYAASQNYGGIRRYDITNETLIISDSNSNVPNLNPFAVFPSSVEMIAVVPTPASNNIQIYENVY